MLNAVKHTYTSQWPQLSDRFLYAKMTCKPMHISALINATQWDKSKQSPFKTISCLKHMKQLLDS